MKDVFITSTINHSDWNAKFNPKLCKAIEEKGVSCHLPQRDTDQDGTKEDVFQQNIEGIKNANKLLCIAKNESVNWGGEVGFAHGIGKEIISLSELDHQIPLMLRYMIGKKIKKEDLENIDNYIDELVNAIIK